MRNRACEDRYDRTLRSSLRWTTDPGGLHRAVRKDSAALRRAGRRPASAGCPSVPARIAYSSTSSRVVSVIGSAAPARTTSVSSIRTPPRPSR
jgi:hypothetical protein